MFPFCNVLKNMTKNANKLSRLRSTTAELEIFKSSFLNSSITHDCLRFVSTFLLVELGVSMWKWVLASELEGNTDNTRNLK